MNLSYSSAVRIVAVWASGWRDSNPGTPDWGPPSAPLGHSRTTGCRLSPSGRRSAAGWPWRQARQRWRCRRTAVTSPPGGQTPPTRSLGTSRDVRDVRFSLKLAQIGPQMLQIRTFFRAEFSTFWHRALKCTEIWSEKVLDLSHLGPIWSKMY